MKILHYSVWMHPHLSIIKQFIIDYLNNKTMYWKISFIFGTIFGVAILLVDSARDITSCIFPIIINLAGLYVCSLMFKNKSEIIVNKYISIFMLVQYKIYGTEKGRIGSITMLNEFGRTLNGIYEQFKLFSKDLEINNKKLNAFFESYVNMNSESVKRINSENEKFIYTNQELLKEITNGFEEHTNYITRRCIDLNSTVSDKIGSHVTNMSNTAEKLFNDINAPITILQQKTESLTNTFDTYNNKLCLDTAPILTELIEKMRSMVTGSDNIVNALQRTGQALDDIK